MSNITYLLDEDGIPIYKGDIVYLGSDYPYTVNGFCISQSRSLSDFSPLCDEYNSVKLSDGRAYPPEMIKHYWDWKFVLPEYKKKKPTLQKFFWKNIRGNFRLLKHKLTKQ